MIGDLLIIGVITKKCESLEKEQVQIFCLALFCVDC